MTDTEVSREAGRELDVIVAEKVMGYHVEKVRPDWVRNGVEVTLFFAPGSPLVVYSYDGDSCNAMMYRNGIDDKDGYAEPLPNYSEEIADAWEVVEKLRASGEWFVGLKTWGEGWQCAVVAISRSTAAPRNESARETAATAPLAICLAALAAIAPSLGIPSVNAETSNPSRVRGEP